MTNKFSNDLIKETSPYLLQHAYNPIHWKAWNEESLTIAKKENKLIIISVGYAACHWCHVMEHESFEDVEVAQVMNDNYINIKVDREERPDIDQVYMNAVQLLTGSGGWPLNIVALPDGRPIWGGTYFKKKQWVTALNQIASLHQSNPEKLHEYASKLEVGIKSLDIVNLNTEDIKFEKIVIDNAINSWSQSFDYNKGGTNRAPKFMMPNNLHFLLREAYQNNHTELQKYVNVTLTKIAYGGIFDHVGGGFSRYSVDDKWHVPHFEKMLYDNAQLVSLYSDAYLTTKNPLYKEVVYDTINFVERELTNIDGTFYSSLDADSVNHKGHLEEGAFYVWTKVELQNLLNYDFQLFSDYYSINDYGYWEHDNYVLIRKESEETIIKKHNINSDILKQKISQCKSLLLQERDKRNRPRLDDKILTSWNALMIKGYIDAFRVFNEESFLKAAIKNAKFIINKQSKDDGGLNHNYKEGKSTINGYLEDYATTIDAFIAIYENTLDENWLHHSRNLTNYALDYFFDNTSKMFFFTSNQDASLVSRTIEYRDNVIPASNSMMAKNLFKLSHFYSNSSYKNIATTMLHNMMPELKKYPSAFSNWMDLMLNYTNNYYEVAIIGNQAIEKVHFLNKKFIPNKLIAGSNNENDLPLLKNRYSEDKTLIYVCVDKACQFPVSEVDQAINLIR